MTNEEFEKRMEFIIERQAQLAQHTPQPSDAERDSPRLPQSLLQLLKRQVGLLANPIPQLLSHRPRHLARGPYRCSTRSICPVLRRCAEIFPAHGVLTPNRSASSGRLPSPRSQSSSSFRRRSFEYAFAIRLCSQRTTTNHYTPSVKMV